MISRGVRGFGLDRIGDDKAMLLGQSIHARPCREVVGILRAAMQHDKQRAFARMRPAMRNIELVDATSCGAGKGARKELSSVRDLEQLARLCARQAIETYAGKPRLAERDHELAG